MLLRQITGRNSDVPCQPSDGGGGNDAIAKNGISPGVKDMVKFRLSPDAFAPALLHGRRVSRIRNY